MMDGDQFARLGYLALLLVAVAGWVFVEFRHRLGQSLRIFAAWGLIFLGVAAGYGLWNDIANQNRPRQMANAAGEMQLRRAADGHFYAAMLVNGVEVLFMADTGATNMVLSKQDAQRIGFDPDTLQYFGQANTANGVVRTARVKIDSIRFGPFDDTDMPAYVNEGAMDGSLLGMDYLRRFDIKISGDQMLLSR